MGSMGFGASDILDVVVVGAGFSGLAAADRLVKAGKSVVVVEALDRVGGRVYDQKFPNGSVVECGGVHRSIPRSNLGNGQGAGS